MKSSPQGKGAGAQGWEFRNWMRSVDDGKSLAHITIPGTHQSCARYSAAGIDSAFVICQRQGIREQLQNHGVRFLDIRCKITEGRNSFAIHHGAVYQKLMFGDVLRQCKEFLDANPSETVLMRVKQEHKESPWENDALFKEIFYSQYVKECNPHWYLDSSVPTLGQVRGKIVLLGNVAGLGGIDWSDLDVQDDYYPENCWIDFTFHDGHAKRTKIIDHAFKAKASTSGRIFVNFASWTCPPISISKLANQTLPLLYGALIDGSPAGSGYGVIAMDYVGEPYAAELTRGLIQGNM